MKQNKNDRRKELEKDLEKFPFIQDHQDKDELYNKISLQMMEEEPKKRKRVIMPIFALVAVLFLTALILPPILIDQSGEDSMDIATESNEGGEDNSETLHDEQSAELSQIPSEMEVTERDMDGSELQSYLVFEKFKENPFIIAVAAGMNGEQIIPFAITTKDGQLNYTTTTTLVAEQAEELGVAGFPLQGTEINRKGTEADIIFPEDFQMAGGSSSDVMLHNSIEQTFQNSQVSQVNLKYKDGRPFEMGNFGTVESLTIASSVKVSYKLYNYPATESKFLVPIKIDENATIEEAFQTMIDNEGGESIDSPIPAGVSLKGEEASEELLSVTITTSNKLEPDQQSITMIEAVLATAASFGYEHVHLHGLPFRSIDRYDLSNPLETPVAVNPLLMDTN